MEKSTGLTIVLFYGSALFLMEIKFCSPTCSDTYYEIKSSKLSHKTRRTIMKDGDFILQGILPFTINCNLKRVRKSGFMYMMVMQFAMEKANKLLPEFDIGYQFDDSCLTIPAVMSRGIEIVSLHRPNSVCRAEYLNCTDQGQGQSIKVKAITAVIGPSASFTSIPLASLLGLYDIPQLSFSASSRLLSKQYYKSFFRTMPSDVNQVAVMIDIMKEFNWTYIFAIGSDDNYGKLAISTLKKLAANASICVAQDEYISFQIGGNYTLKQAKGIAQKLKEAKQTQVVVMFTYTTGQGDLIIKEARKLGVKRMWLTSDAWYPYGTQLTKTNVNRNDLIGILTVSSHRGSIPGLKEYIYQKISKDYKYKCNIWLQASLKEHYDCKVSDLNGQGLNCKNTTLNTILNSLLSKNNGRYANLIDAVMAVIYALKSVLKKKCQYGTKLFNKTLCIPIKPNKIMDALHQVAFNGTLNNTIRFNAYGDPEISSYFIDNIQEEQDILKFVHVGEWTSTKQRGGKLHLESKKIVWPKGFQRPPKSKCSEDCKAGEFISAKTECCWKCQPCAKNEISDDINSKKCDLCDDGHHTNVEHTKCFKTPIEYLSPKDPGGISIITISCIGFVITFVMVVIFMSKRNSMVITTSTPNLIFFSLILLLISFPFGFSHIAKPTDSICSGKTGYFYMLFITYVSILLVKTRFVIDFLETIKQFIKIEVSNLQLIGIGILMLIQLLIVIVWLTVDPVKINKYRSDTKEIILLQCNVDFNTSRIIATSFPCFILLMATVAAFRERHDQHPFNEPKFLSFALIAMCIVIVAFLPTFKYVVGIFQSIVIAFTVDICAYIYICCLLVPKLYIMLSQKSGVELTNIQPGENIVHAVTDTVGNEGKQTTSNNSPQITDSNIVTSPKTKPIHSSSSLLNIASVTVQSSSSVDNKLLQQSDGTAIETFV